MSNMIKNWLSGWLGKESMTSAYTPSPAWARNAEAASAYEVAPASVTPVEVDPAFHRWLCGPGGRDAAPGIEQLLLDELGRLAQSPGAGAHLVPRVPAIIPKLLRSLRDDNMSSGELSRLLSQDVVLVAEVIRGANSPYYSPHAPIKTIESAVMLLGQNGMRLLLARVAFRPVISTQTGTYARLAAPHIWRHAEKCAMAANILAPRLRANPFEAYLAGLMQNVGLIVAFRLIDQLYPDAALPQSDHFYIQLAAHARKLSARIASMWEFPPAVAAAIEQAGNDGPAPLARTLALADRIAKLRILVDARQLDEAEPSVLAGLDAATLACFEQIKTGDDSVA